jgi:hypothetical protein
MKVLAGFNGCGMVAVRPKGTQPYFLCVVLPRGAPCDQLNVLRDLILAFIENEKMHVIGCAQVIQYANSIALSSLEQPAQIHCPVAGEFEQEIALMSPMGDVPDVGG